MLKKSSKMHQLNHNHRHKNRNRGSKIKIRNVRHSEAIINLDSHYRSTTKGQLFEFQGDIDVKNEYYGMHKSYNLHG